jgi:hypothetical protein
MSGDRQNDLVGRAYQVGVAAAGTAAASDAVPDQRTLIRVLAIIQIVLGGFCCLGMVSVVVVLFHSPTSPVLASLPIYAVPAVNLLLTGIGSVRVRPWARRATLISAFLWLGVIGIGAVVMLGRVGGNGYETAMGGAILVLALALAIVLIVVYTLPSVRVTFERRRAR